MKFLAHQGPSGPPGLVHVHGRVVPHAVHGIRRAPDLGGQLFLHAERQPVAHEVRVGVALGVAVVLGVDDHPALAVVLVGVVLGVPHLPVERAVVPGPGVLGDGPLREQPGRALAEDLAQLAPALGDARQDVEEERRVASLEFVPGDGGVLSRAKPGLEQPVVVQLLEVALQLAVVAPDAKVVGQVHAHHAGLQRGLALQAAGELLEEAAAEQESGTGILGHFPDAVLGRHSRHLDDGVAADGAGCAAVAAHRVLPGALAQKEGCAVGAVGDAVQVVDVAGDLDGRLCRAPALAWFAHPAGAGIVVLGLRGGEAGHHMLVVPAQDGQVKLDELLPLALVPGDAHCAAALHAHGLEVLGAHDPAHAASGVRQGVGHNGHGRELFPGLADGRHHAVRAHLLADLQAGAPNARAPQLRGVAQFHPGIADIQPHRFLGPALHDERVIARILELGGELAAHVPGAHQRPGPAGGEDGGHRGAAVAGHARARQHARGEDELVGGIKGAGSGGHLLPEDLVAEARAAEHFPVPLSGVLGADLPCGQIHAQHLSGKAAIAPGHVALLEGIVSAAGRLLAGRHVALDTGLGLGRRKGGQRCPARAPLAGKVAPGHEAQGTRRAGLHAFGLAMAQEAFGGLLALFVEGDHVPGAGPLAQAAAHAAPGIHHPGPGFGIGLDGILRAGRGAGHRVRALAAHALDHQAIAPGPLQARSACGPPGGAIRPEIHGPVDPDAGLGGLGAAIVELRAGQLAALAAHAAGGVGQDQALGVVQNHQRGASAQGIAQPQGSEAGHGAGREHEKAPPRKGDLHSCGAGRQPDQLRMSFAHHVCSRQGGPRGT